ncbi:MULTISPECIES: helix-turn-helix domain-containing protein [Xanthomonas]|uniref:Helix-turn-helix transcriptional regulator n=2 Tax=Xanthomonas TaxID=338 RepID=A0AAJ3CED4_XANCA|nr:MULTISPECIES: helix-turn-helix transcriptional regulator [Xanthomonas]MEB1502708.1 helix-turn-helix transcriptional regulator [Xanthomonas campestris pv. campestris]MEB1527310.1 helix-turn-helix transcriptional regulator [Xanthomonas campestris pv. campestris]MEB1587812.1 helix-turn-helix transcriptional regulator [Xanthomonas campestris pv. campestris]MEB1600003.1 helix-turn-helix transcriptional regulator [Xanthomonas campestris pv. campestris]MEB1661002.1 helix-turn-helix transcriptional
MLKKISPVLRLHRHACCQDARARDCSPLLLHALLLVPSCDKLTCHVESTRGVRLPSCSFHACTASIQPVKPATPAPREIVAARLRQARERRGLSQREVGMRMGLDKDTASARISRYESGAMSISLEALFEMAEALEVPPAFLLAGTPGMADAILALGEQSHTQQDQLAKVLVALSKLEPKVRAARVQKLLMPNADE